MFDFHSHVLPGLDDGARDVIMSLKMLSMSKNQGVTSILASPHFFADRMNIMLAKKAREASYNDVIAYAENNNIKIPEIILGFEVHLSTALMRLNNVKELCIEGTNTMLLEMPYAQWTDRTFEIIDYLKDECGVLPLIAHIERYADMEDTGMYDMLLSKGYFAQVNANSFINRKRVRMLDEMIINEQIHVVGSDAHNLLRCSLMDVAYNHVRRELGEKYIEYFEKNDKLLMNSSL